MYCREINYIDFMQLIFFSEKDFFHEIIQSVPSFVRLQRDNILTMSSLSVCLYLELLFECCSLMHITVQYITVGVSATKQTMSEISESLTVQSVTCRTSFYCTFSGQ